MFRRTLWRSKNYVVLIYVEMKHNLGLASFFFARRFIFFCDGDGFYDLDRFGDGYRTFIYQFKYEHSIC